MNRKDIQYHLPFAMQRNQLAMFKKNCTMMVLPLDPRLPYKTILDTGTVQPNTNCLLWL